MSSSDSYKFYVHFENLKNSLYRQLSNARKSHLFIPNFYYNWFYVQEKQEYNNLIKRQRIGITIEDKEIHEYNQIKKNFGLSSKFKIVKHSSATENGVIYDDIQLKRGYYPIMPLIGFGLFSHFYLQLSRYWLAGSLIPILLLMHHDSKFTAKEEIESFYNYVIERRDANTLYKKNKNILDNFQDKESLKIIKNELTNSNKSLEEAINQLNLCYLNAARSTK
jgi:hypothetical protein